MSCLSVPRSTSDYFCLLKFLLMATTAKATVKVDENRRHWIIAIFLQIGIRIRYIYESRFGLIPLFTPLTDYPSPWRPKECPKYDFFTQVN